MPEKSLEKMSLGEIIREVADLAVVDAIAGVDRSLNMGRAYEYALDRTLRQKELYQELDRREKIYNRYKAPPRLGDN